MPFCRPFAYGFPYRPSPSRSSSSFSLPSNLPNLLTFSLFPFVFLFPWSRGDLHIPCIMNLRIRQEVMRDTISSCPSPCFFLLPSFFPLLRLFLSLFLSPSLIISPYYQLLTPEFRYEAVTRAFFWLVFAISFSFCSPLASSSEITLFSRCVSSSLPPFVSASLLDSLFSAFSFYSSYITSDSDIC